MTYDHDQQQILHRRLRLLRQGRHELNCNAVHRHSLVDARGEANVLVQGLARRFLHHALSRPPDLGMRFAMTPAIFALIADETGGTGKVLGFELQRRIRAALLDVDPGELRARVDELAERHDFVLAAAGRVREEVATVVRMTTPSSARRLA